jgi:Zn-dependent peptidase ImmA (M78 family)
MLILSEKLRRGFKAEAERYAEEFRVDLGIRPSHPLDMFLLAEHLAIPTLALSRLQGELSALNYQCLINESKKQFFAVTLSVGNRKFIVFNDHVAPTRQQSDMAHELSHAILGHPASELTDESGGRNYNKTLEAEATCLSGVLLVPRAAAIAVVASNKHPHVAANEFNVSPQMMTMRLNQSGAKRIMGYGRA